MSDGNGGNHGRRGSRRHQGYDYDWPGISGFLLGSRSRFRKRSWVSRGGLAERFSILVIVAILIGVTAGLLLPRMSGPLGRMTGRYVATGPVADTLARLQVDDHPTVHGYHRDSFAYNTIDPDGDGCTIRDDILDRDLTQIRLVPGSSCRVKSGQLDDPYTGRTIHFVRGKDTSEAVQIDHVVALENAWQSGARHWDAAERQEYGNDPLNLLAVDGPANQEKGSASAAYWLPSNRSFRCGYVARQVAVKAKYGLTVTTLEKQSISEVLHACPAERLPTK
ncbi:Protein of unknown function [Bifidobacterium bohemicum]|uniref:GmrSD restriction endonucleases C-terminal domain-containing protein n=1 Tax=Bifidobacterium bohemicum DSM 22767 TaxID=1437606 RepID=A0A086ZH03_9BIFI|nr:HNH endonuclease family protein [Bifidobacterium bohemicum]KFI45803.1 hypothetical protein BBOH_0606 [Bifidobacterium bohemicum DSM 22767]SCC10575.1 Protein of unknown function [Bifidobacterium bohemicum]